MSDYTKRVYVYDAVYSVARKLEENGIDFSFDDGEHILLKPEDVKDARDLLEYCGIQVEEN